MFLFDRLSFAHDGEALYTTGNDISLSVFILTAESIPRQPTRLATIFSWEHFNSSGGVLASSDAAGVAVDAGVELLVEQRRVVGLRVEVLCVGDDVGRCAACVAVVLEDVGKVETGDGRRRAGSGERDVALSVVGREG